MTIEEWLPVVGFEGKYEVSNLGRIRSLRSGRLLHIGSPSRGYPRIMLGQKATRVHRVVAAAFLGPCPPGKEVNHKNGIKNDPRLDNLEYVTRSENILHAVKIGNLVSTASQGEKNRHAKLTESDVLAIREYKKQGWHDNDLATKYNVCRISIERIHSRKYWKHIPG